MKRLCRASFLHKSHEQFNFQGQQMPLNTTWKKILYINTGVQLQIHAAENIIYLGNLFLWNKLIARSSKISLDGAN